MWFRTGQLAGRRQAIYEANKDKMKTASDILPGKKLVIPSLAPPARLHRFTSNSAKPPIKPRRKPPTSRSQSGRKTRQANPQPDPPRSSSRKNRSEKDSGKIPVKSARLVDDRRKTAQRSNRYREIISECPGAPQTSDVG
jgi:hypothetical protein